MSPPLKSPLLSSAHRRRIIFFNRFFFPDTSATSQMLSDLAFHLSHNGHDVRVITTFRPGDKREETIEGVVVHRVTAAVSGQQSLIARGLAYFRYYFASSRCAKHLLQPGDVAVVKTDPPMLSVVIAPIAKKRGATFVAWLQDLFPEVAREYGVPGFSGPVERALRRLRDRSLRAADAIVTIGTLMAEQVARITGSSDRIHVIENWADGESIVPIESGKNVLRQKWNLDTAFVVGYSGNLGRVHEFETLISAAKRLRDDFEVVFLIIGQGPQRVNVEASVKRERLSNVRFADHQPRANLALVLSLPDLHVSVLRPEFEGFVHPSKVYGILAAGRPQIFIGDNAGETSRILARTDSGICIGCGDSAALAEAITQFKNDRSLRERLGRNARKAFDSQYSMHVAMAKWEELLRL